MSITVYNEIETIAALREGASIARYGDGEIDLAYGMRDEVFENRGPDLTLRMRTILETEQPGLLVGVPNIFSEEAKSHLGNPVFWERYEPHFRERLLQDRVYHSAFISRPDNISRHPDDEPGSNAKRVDAEFWQVLQSIWEGKKVAIVHFEASAENHPLYANTESRVFIPCSQRNAWGDGGDRYRELLKTCLDHAMRETIDMFLISAGPVACVLASDLCAQNIQAIDIGQAARVYSESLGEDHLHLY